MKSIGRYPSHTRFTGAKAKAGKNRKKKPRSKRVHQNQYEKHSLKRTPPNRLEAAHRVCKALGVSVSDLVESEETK